MNPLFSAIYKSTKKSIQKASKKDGNLVLKENPRAAKLSSGNLKSLNSCGVVRPNIH